MATSIWAIIGIIVLSAIGAFAAINFKKGSEKISFNIKSFIYNKYIIYGVLLYVFTTIFFVPLLKYGELSVLYPFVAAVYIWTSIFSIWLLKEKMNTYKWIGIASIIIGAFFIGMGI